MQNILSALKRYQEIDEEIKELEQVSRNAFNVFNENCPFDDFDVIFEISWSQLYKWNEIIPNGTEELTIQEGDFVKSLFEQVKEGRISREEFEVGLDKTVQNVQEYNMHLQYEMEDIEKEVQDAFKAYVENIDNKLLRELLLVLIPYVIPSNLINFLMYADI